MRKFSILTVLFLSAVMAGCSQGHHGSDGGVIIQPSAPYPEEALPYNIDDSSATAPDSLPDVSVSTPEDVSVSMPEDVSDVSVTEKADSGITESSAPGQAGTFTATDWKTFEVEIDGAVVRFPCSYQEFADRTGYRLEQADYAQQTLKSGYEANEWLVSDADPDRSVTVYFCNDSDAMRTYAECPIYGIYTYPGKELNGKTYASFSLANGIDGSATAEQVRDTLGEPMRESNIDGAVILRYTVNETGSGGQMEFQFTPEGTMDTFIEKAH